MDELTPRERILNLLARKPIDRMPCFSGMSMLTMPAIAALGIRFSQVHHEAECMAGAAMKSMEMFGFESAVIPFDVGLLSEAYGLKLRTYDDSGDLTFPTIPDKWADPDMVQVPDDYMQRARMPIVDEAIGILRQKIGETHAVGTWIFGPFSLACQLMDLNVLLKMTMKQPEKMTEILDRLTDALAELANHYRDLGADYVTVREMSTGTDILSPKMWESLIKPHLIKLFQAIPSPKILHICGSTDAIIEKMNQCGADAISVEDKNSLAQSRQKIGNDVLLFGDYHGYGLTSQASLEEINDHISYCVKSGVDAVWPGCDIWPEVKEENLHSINELIRELGKAPTPAVART